MDARERILDAALRVFAEAGFRGATTRRIAEAAEVNEVTLFRRFGNKESLLREAMRWAPHRMPSPSLPPQPRDPPRELSRWCCEHLRGLHQVRALLRTSISEFESFPDVGAPACEVPTRVARDLEAYVSALQAAGRADPGCDARAAAALLMGAMLADAISRDLMPGRYPYPLDESAAKYVTLFLRAIGFRAAGAA